MLLKKIKKYWISFWQSKKRKYILFILILIMAVAGYIGLVSEKEEKSKNNKSAQQELQEEFIKIMEGAEEIYENCQCACATCRAGYSRALLHSLITNHSFYGEQLLLQHNLFTLNKLMSSLRQAIKYHQTKKFVQELLQNQ